LVVRESTVDAVIRQAKRSLELNPNYALAIDLLGTAMMHAGDAEAGLRECKRALDANPRFPANNWFMDSMAIEKPDHPRHQMWLLDLHQNALTKTVSSNVDREASR
jgi:hypothetical protein